MSETKDENTYTLVEREGKEDEYQVTTQETLGEQSRSNETLEQRVLNHPTLCESDRSLYGNHEISLKTSNTSDLSASTHQAPESQSLHERDERDTDDPEEVLDSL